MERLDDMTDVAASHPNKDALITPETKLDQHPWNLLHSQSDRLHGAHCLIGIPKETLQAHADYLMISSKSTVQALESMDAMIRTLNTALENGVELSMMSVHGPILWSETMTARAHSFGNEDVYMCRVTTRTFNTAENRFILAILKSLVNIHSRLQSSDLWGDLDESEQEHLTDLAQQARSWSQHSRLSQLSRKPLRTRELTTIRHSPRHLLFEPFLELHDRRRTLFTLHELSDFIDPVTREYLEHVVDVTNAVGALTRLPARWSVTANGLERGELSFRHPRADGKYPSGICVRGVPVPAHLDVEARFSRLRPESG